MQIFKVFGLSGKLCMRMDHYGKHIVDAPTHAWTRRTLRDSRETAAKHVKYPVRDSRNSRETPARHRETAARHPRNSRESVQGTHRG